MVPTYGQLVKVIVNQQFGIILKTIIFISSGVQKEQLLFQTDIVKKLVKCSKLEKVVFLDFRREFATIERTLLIKKLCKLRKFC